MIRKALLLVLPLLLVLGFAANSAQARDDYRDRRHREIRRGYNNRGHSHDGYYRQGEYRGRRHHGYWRRYHGRRYWYQDGGYYARPGGVSINIGL